GSNEFGSVAACTRLWRADAGGRAAGPRRRHLRYSRRSAFQSGQACEDNRVLQERGGDRQGRGRKCPDPAARQGGLSRDLRRAGRGVKDADHGQDHLPLSSLTKVITSVVAMQLIQDGKI